MKCHISSWLFTKLNDLSSTWLSDLQVIKIAANNSNGNQMVQSLNYVGANWKPCFFLANLNSGFEGPKGGNLTETVDTWCFSASADVALKAWISLSIEFMTTKLDFFM